MNESLITNQEERDFYTKHENLTDREIQEKIIFQQSKILKNTESIKQNVLFWFYLTVLSLFFAIIMTVNK